VWPESSFTIPALGGGHSKHHYYHYHGTDESTVKTNVSDGKKKRVKIPKILCSFSKKVPLAMMLKELVQKTMMTTATAHYVEAMRFALIS